MKQTTLASLAEGRCKLRERMEASEREQIRREMAEEIAADFENEPGAGSDARWAAHRIRMKYPRAVTLRHYKRVSDHASIWMPEGQMPQISVIDTGETVTGPIEKKDAFNKDRT